MKATEQYFPVVLFIMLFKVVLAFESLDEIVERDHWNTSYRAILSYGTVFYAVQDGSTVESVEEILECDHLSQSYWAVLSCGDNYCATKGGSYSSTCQSNAKVWPFKWKLVRLLCCTKWFYSATFESVDEILIMIIQMNATEQYFPLVLFVLLYKLVINIKCSDGILKCGRSLPEFGGKWF